MAVRGQHVRQTKSTSSKIGEMAYAHKRGVNLETEAPYKGWLKSVTKDEIKGYAEFYGHEVGNVLKINMISIIAGDL